MIKLEICVDTLDGAEAAVAGGADRIELCSSLSEGGLTPSIGLMQAAAALPIPVHAMIRPRSGLFEFSDGDAKIMEADVNAARTVGLAGVVLGAQKPDGTLDTRLLSRLIAAAGHLDATLHRVIDVVPDPLAALSEAIDLGFTRVLTSGAQPFAPDGVPLIRQMVEATGGRISIMPGCGLTPENVTEVVRATGVTEVHAACSAPAPGDPAFSDFDPPGGRNITSEDAVRQMVAALQH